MNNILIGTSIIIICGVVFYLRVKINEVDKRIDDLLSWTSEGEK